MRASGSLLTLVVLAGTGLLARPAQAQSFTISPVVGVYAPLASRLDRDAGISAKHRTGLLAGGKIAWQSHGGLGIDAGAAYAASDIRASDGAILEAHLILISARGTYSLTHDKPFQPFVALGGGILLRRGDIYRTGVDGKDDFGANVGVGARFLLGPRIALRLEAESFLYSAKFGKVDTESDFQADLGLTAGASIRLGRGR